MARTNLSQFIRQVRQEFSKVVWPNRRETVISTGMVMLMVFLAALFFMLVDQVFSWSIKLIFGLRE